MVFHVWEAVQEVFPTVVVPGGLPDPGGGPHGGLGGGGGGGTGGRLPLQFQQDGQIWHRAQSANSAIALSDIGKYPFLLGYANRSHFVLAI